MPPDCDGESDWEVIECAIRDFIAFDKSDRRPILFVDPGEKDRDLDDVVCGLKKIDYEMGRDQDSYRVLGLETLFFRLVQRAQEITGNDPFQSIEETRNKMNKNEFTYSQIGCKFHNDEDVLQYCCLAR